MPLYEYECDACGARFELIQKFSDPPAETCRKCGAGPVHKLVSSPAFQFKGTGWYITDYARKGESGGSKSESATKPSASDSGAAEKPAADKPADKPAAPAASASTKDSSS